MQGRDEKVASRRRRSRPRATVVDMTFFRALLDSPSSTPLSRYTAWNGAFYMAFGALTYAWPGVVQTLLMGAPFQGREEGLVRVAGFSVLVIGWFYVFGARTRAASFALATVVDRALVPVFLLPLGLTGAIEPNLAYAFSVLDPVLGLGAYLVWRRSTR